MYVRFIYTRVRRILREVGSVQGAKTGKKKVHRGGETRGRREEGHTRLPVGSFWSGRDSFRCYVPLNRSTDTRTVPRPCSPLATGSCEVFHCQHLQQPLNATLVTLYSRYFFIFLAEHFNKWGAGGIFVE